MGKVHDLSFRAAVKDVLYVWILKNKVIRKGNAFRHSFNSNGVKLCFPNSGHTIPSKVMLREMSDPQ